MDLIEYGRKNVLLRSTPDSELVRLLPYAQISHGRLRDVVYRSGDPMTHAYFPLDALFSSVTPLPEGEFVEHSLVGPEGMVGLALITGLRESPWQVVVQGEGAAVAVDASFFYDGSLAACPSLSARLQSYLGKVLAATAQLVACNRFHLATPRLARWLLMVHDRQQRDSLAITHEFIAQMVGVTRPVVTIGLGELEDMGVIRLGRERIEILDRGRLEGLACSCYRVLSNLFSPAGHSGS